MLLPVTAGAQDLSTPKSAARAFTEALDKGDAPLARAAAITDERNAAFIDVMAEFVQETRKLNEAAIARFGDSGKAVAGKEPEKDLTKYFDEAEITESGDSATITRKDEPKKALTLRRTDGVWKVDLATLLGDELDIENTVRMFRAMNASMREMTSEIADGKHASADAARHALAMKNVEFFASAQNAPSTAPSTAPATAPVTQPAEPK